MLHLLYNILIVLALPGVLLRLLWRSRKNPGYALRIHERFGFYGQTFQKGGIIIHAVSVGETVAAQPLIEMLLKHYPDQPITITSMTPTGSARVKNTFGSSVQHVYLPYDYPWVLRRFFKTFEPSKLIIMETEWWPNLFIQAKKRNIPLYVANARLSERSLKGYLKIASLSKKMAECITHISAQTQSDAERFIALGVPPQRVSVAGNIKFDFTVDSLTLERSAKFKANLNARPVWIAASTHAGEEAIVIQTIQKVLQQSPEALAIVVPRHPERFASFYQALCSAGLTVARRSTNQTPEKNTQVYLGDTMGELVLMYGAADVAFVGGSFVPSGGHNMLEAAMMGCAIVMGPHLENVKTQSAELIKRQGMIGVDTPEVLAEQIVTWLNNPQQKDKCVKHAQAFMQDNKGAVERTFNLFFTS